MSEEGYKTEIALTSEGHVMAILHDQVLLFNNLADLGGFIDELRVKTDSLSHATSPLDDQTATEVATAAIQVMEERAKTLSDVEGSDEAPGRLKGETQVGTLMDALTTFFSEDSGGWKFDQIDDSKLRVPVKGKNGAWLSIAQVFEQIDRAACYSFFPTNVPAEKYPEMAEYLTRANWDLLLGNFEMDYSDGELRYRTSIDVEGERLSPNLVKQMVYENFATTDKHFPGIMKILYGDTPVVEALESLSQTPTDVETREEAETEYIGR